VGGYIEERRAGGSNELLYVVHAWVGGWVRGWGFLGASMIAHSHRAHASFCMEKMVWQPLEMGRVYF